MFLNHYLGQGKCLGEGVSAELDISDCGSYHHLDHLPPGHRVNVLVLGDLHHSLGEESEAGVPGVVVDTLLPHRGHGHHLPGGHDVLDDRVPFPALHQLTEVVREHLAQGGE